MKYTVGNAYQDGRIEVFYREKQFEVKIKEGRERVLEPYDEKDLETKVKMLSSSVFAVITGDKEEFTKPELEYASRIICRLGKFRALLKKASKIEKEMSEDDMNALAKVREELSDLMKQLDPKSEGDVDVLQEAITDAYKKIQENLLKNEEYLLREALRLKVNTNQRKDALVLAVLEAGEIQGMFAFT